MVIHHSRAADGYNSSFIADAQKITDHIKDMVWKDTGKKPKEVEFDCNFWNKYEMSEVQTDVSPSKLCEEGTRQVVPYLVRNQKFIVEVKEKLVIVGDDTPDQDEEEESDDEGVENGYESE